MFTGGGFFLDVLRSADGCLECRIPHPAMPTDIAFADERSLVTTCLDGRVRFSSLLCPLDGRGCPLTVETETVTAKLGEGSGIATEDRELCYACAVYSKLQGDLPSRDPNHTHLRIVTACREAIEIWQVVVTPDERPNRLQRIGPAIEHLHVDVINQLSLMRGHLLVSAGDDGLICFTDLLQWETAVAGRSAGPQQDVSMEPIRSGEGDDGNNNTSCNVASDQEEGLFFTINNDENVRSFLIVPEYDAIVCASTNETITVWHFGSSAKGSGGGDHQQLGGFASLRKLVRFTEEVRHCPSLLSGEPDGFHTLGCVLHMWAEKGKIFVLGGSCAGNMVLFELTLTSCTPVQNMGVEGDCFARGARRCCAVGTGGAEVALSWEMLAGSRRSPGAGGGGRSSCTGDNNYSGTKRACTDKTGGHSSTSRIDVETKTDNMEITDEKIAAAINLGQGAPEQEPVAAGHTELVRCCAVLRAEDGKVKELWTGDESGHLLQWPAKGKKRSSRDLL
eukprot:g17093.t1